jgi:hypothetical protein
MNATSRISSTPSYLHATPSKRVQQKKAQVWNDQAKVSCQKKSSPRRPNSKSKPKKVTKEHKEPTHLLLKNTGIVSLAPNTRPRVLQHCRAIFWTRTPQQSFKGTDDNSTLAGAYIVTSDPTSSGASAASSISDITDNSASFFSVKIDKGGTDFDRSQADADKNLASHRVDLLGSEGNSDGVFRFLEAMLFPMGEMSNNVSVHRHSKGTVITSPPEWFIQCVDPTDVEDAEADSILEGMMLSIFDEDVSFEREIAALREM